VSEKRPNRLEPPKKIELRSANTNPNPAPSGPPPVSQVRPHKSGPDYKALYEQTAVYNERLRALHIKTTAKPADFLGRDDPSKITMVIKVNISAAMDDEYAVDLRKAIADDVLKTMRAEIAKRLADAKTLADQIENVEQIRDEEGGGR
jgi:hypothetical protein